MAVYLNFNRVTGRLSIYIAQNAKDVITHQHNESSLSLLVKDYTNMPLRHKLLWHWKHAPAVQEHFYQTEFAYSSIQDMGKYLHPHNTTRFNE